MRVELTSGGWVDIVDPADLRDKDRKAVNKAVTLQMDEAGKPVIPGDMDDNMRDALLKRIVTAWSFEAIPLPRDDPKCPEESLDRLTIPDAREIHEAIKPHMTLITGAKSPTAPGEGPAQS
jgi:hypothetical protein